jgi:multidrug resistance protein, MATE family
VLVFGGMGLEPMGVVGCAWATFIVNTATCAAALMVLRLSKQYQVIELFTHWEKPNLPRLKSFAKLGVPAGLASMVEVTSYTLMGLLVARLGVQATAAHQIAASVAAVLFMLPLALSISSVSRVSYWMGAGNTELAHRLARLAVGLTVGVAIFANGVMLLLSQQIASAYSSSPQVANTASGLLLFVALYHMADAWQTIGCFLLRCWRITVMPMFVYALTLWAVGLGGGFLLAYRGVAGLAAMQHPSAFWIMGALAMSLAALVFMKRIWSLTRGPVASQAG